MARRVSGWIAGVISVACAGSLLLHQWLPDGVVRLVIESFLPWIGVPIALAVLLAAIRRRRFAALLAVAAAFVWAVVVVPRALPLESGTSSPDITIVTQNLGSDGTAVETLISELIAEDPDVIVLQEITTAQKQEVSDPLAQGGYTYTAQASTVGIWSTFPMTNGEALSLGMDWDRAVRADISTPSGTVRVYAVHALSARLEGHEARNEMLAALGSELAADDSTAIIVAGDFNATQDDTGMSSVQSSVSESVLSGGGFGFTWPSSFPVARPDHVMSRGLTAVEYRVLGTTGSDHLGLLYSASVD